MIINIPDRIFNKLNEQTIERTAERLVYNSSDILKSVVHSQIYGSEGYVSEVKLAISHVLICLLVLTKQMEIDIDELVNLVCDGVLEHRMEW